MKKEQAKKYYRQGVAHYQNANYELAEKYLTKALEHQDTMEDALYELGYIYIYTGRYPLARKLLGDNNCKNFPSLYQARALLEEFECNYKESLANYNLCKKGKYPMLGIANVNRELGNYETAKTMYEFLACSPKNYYDAMENLVALYVVKEDYDAAYRTLLELLKNQLPKEIWEKFLPLIYFVEQKLGVKNPVVSESRIKKLYTGERLIEPDNDLCLINHITKHVDNGKQQVNGVFYKGIYFKPILIDVRERLLKENPSYSYQFQSNIFLLEDIVGSVNGEPTNAIKVGTYVNTDTILTMYPVLISDEFDKEGNNTSEELRRKRKK